MSRSRYGKDKRNEIERGQYAIFLAENKLAPYELGKQALIAELKSAVQSNLEEYALQFKPENYVPASVAIKSLAMVGMVNEDQLKILILYQDALSQNNASISLLAKQILLNTMPLNTMSLVNLLRNNELKNTKSVYQILKHLSNPKCGLSSEEFNKIIPSILEKAHLMSDVLDLISAKGLIPFHSKSLLNPVGDTLDGEKLKLLIVNAEYARSIHDYLRAVADINDEIILAAMKTVIINSKVLKINEIKKILQIKGPEVPLRTCSAKLTLLKDRCEFEDLFLTDMRQYACDLAQCVRHLDDNGIINSKNVNAIFRHLASLSKINNELKTHLPAERKSHEHIDFPPKLVVYGHETSTNDSTVDQAITLLYDKSNPAPESKKLDPEIDSENVEAETKGTISVPETKHDKTALETKRDKPELETKIQQDMDSSSLKQKAFDKIIKRYDNAMKFSFLLGTHKKNLGTSSVCLFGSTLNSESKSIPNHPLSDPKIISNIFKFL